MFCSKCGVALTEGAQFCTACGAPVTAAAPPSSFAPPADQPVASLTPAPYAPRTPAYPPHYAAPPRVDYAGFWLRLVATFIDGLIMGVPLIFAFIFIAAVMGVSGAFKNLESSDSPNDIISLIGFGFFAVVYGSFMIVTWLYYAACESSTWQATLGKKALGLYVTDLNGNRVTFGRASGRFFARIITGLIPLAIGYIMAGFTQKKQALHDMIASCLVLRRL